MIVLPNYCMVTFLLLDYKNIHYALIENVQHLITQDETSYHPDAQAG